MSIPKLLENWHEPFEFPSLLEEFKNYTPECMTLGHRARRVYYSCLRRKKFKLAEKILKKYNSIFPDEYKDDLTVAFGWAFIVSQKN